MNASKIEQLAMYIESRTDLSFDAESQFSDVGDGIGGGIGAFAALLWPDVRNSGFDPRDPDSWTGYDPKRLSDALGLERDFLMDFLIHVTDCDGEELCYDEISRESAVLALRGLASTGKCEYEGHQRCGSR